MKSSRSIPSTILPLCFIVITLFCIQHIASGQSEYVDTNHLKFESHEIYLSTSEKVSSQHRHELYYFNAQLGDEMHLLDSMDLGTGTHGSSNRGQVMVYGDFGPTYGNEAIFYYSNNNEIKGKKIYVDSAGGDLTSAGTITQAFTVSNDRWSAVGVKIDATGYEKAVVAREYNGNVQFTVNGAVAYTESNAYDPKLAKADFNNDGYDEIVLMAKYNNVPFIRVYSYSFAIRSQKLLLPMTMVDMRMTVACGNVKSTDTDDEIVFGYVCKYTGDSDNFNDTFFGYIDVDFSNPSVISLPAPTMIMENRTNGIDANLSVGLSLQDLNIDGEDEIIFSAGNYSNLDIEIYDVENNNLVQKSTTNSITHELDENELDNVGTWLVAGNFNINTPYRGLSLARPFVGASPDDKAYVNIKTYTIVPSGIEYIFALQNQKTVHGQTNRFDNVDLSVFNADHLKVKFGAGEYHYVSDYKRPIAVLYSPPVHFDIINGDTVDISGCFSGDCDFHVAYEEQSSSQSYIYHEVTGKQALSEETERVAGIVGIEFSEMVETSVGNAVTELVGLTKSSSQSIRVKAKGGVDMLYAMVTDYNIWEYPVYVNDKFIGHYSTVAPDTTTIAEFRKTGNHVDDFFSHEPGNLLSYPVNGTDFLHTDYELINQTPWPTSLDVTSGLIIDASYTFGSGLDNAVQKTHALEENLTTVRQITPTLALGPISVGAGMSSSMKSAYSRSSTSMHQSTIEDVIKVEVSFGSDDFTIPANREYKVEPYLYFDTTGVMYMNYAVKFHPSGGTNSSWYYENYGTDVNAKQDPAFIMPHKLSEERGLTGIHEVEKNRTTSIQMWPREPVPGDTVRISALVNNFSLGPGPSDSIEVLFYMETYDGMCATPIRSLSGVSTFVLPPIQPRGLKEISFQWIYPDSLGDHPRLWGVIDPNNKIDEIHERNNRAFFNYFNDGSGKLRFNIDSAVVGYARELPATVYVDKNATGTGDGSSWANAFTDLKIALSPAHLTKPDTIKVAAATYIPETTSSCSINTGHQGYEISHDVVLLGGYPSGGGVRDWKSNKTIISGDIGVVGDSTDNVAKLIIMRGLSSKTKMDGFIIRDSYTYGVSHYERRGGGLYIESCDSVKVENCVFENNSANWGAGCYVHQSNASFYNVVFNDNWGHVNGGGAYCYYSQVDFNQCLFNKGYGGFGGGGIRNWGYCDVKVYQCTFYDNYANHWGGALYNHTYSHAEVYNCIFWKNRVNPSYPQSTLDFRTTNNSRIKVHNSIVTVDESEVSDSITYENCLVDVNPMFSDTLSLIGDDATWMTADDGLQLRYTSPAINIGDSTDVSNTTDMVNNQRIIGAAIDLGPYEFDYHFPCGAYADLYIPDVPIVGATYRSAGELTSDGKVLSASNVAVHFQSTESVELLPEFEVMVGQEFTVDIQDPCQD